jgi:predicted RNA-binding Zn-ribbon protein involved in translation (DUF1610 family)
MKDEPRRRPSWPKKSRQVTDEDREVAFLAALCTAFKARLEVGEVRSDLFCPLCGKKIHIAREKNRGALRVNCTGKDCLALME